MNTEFLIPTRYQGVTCGISVVIFGLDTDTEYNQMAVLLGDIEKIVVPNGIQSTVATFDNLEENKFYTLVASINGTEISECKMVANMKQEVNPVMLKSRAMATAGGKNQQSHMSGGKTRVPPKPREV